MGRIRRLRKSKKRSKRCFESVDSDQRYVDLMQFMKQKEWNNELKLRVAEFRDNGRGVYSLKGVKSGEVLIKVPRSSMITLDTLENDAEFPELCAHYFKEKKCTYQCLLSLFLVFHDEKQWRSPWEAYLKTLPRRYSNPYFCDKKELRYLDEHLLQKMVNQKEIVKKGHDLLNEFECECDMSDFQWAYFTVNTRGVYLDPALVKKEHFKDMLEDSPTIALVPFLDFFNHSDQAISTATADSTSYTLKTENSFKKYEQIFISYGSHNNLKLLLEYGFIVPNNRHDYIEITVNDINNLIKSDPELRATQIPRPKFQFIKDHNFSDQMFFDDKDGPSHNLQTVLFMVFLEKNVHNLRNVAYGDALKAEEVKPYVKKLLDWKMDEYKKFADGLSTLKNKSPSGDACLQYYQECLRYLQKCTNII